MSSSRALLSAETIEARSASVSLPCESIELEDGFLALFELAQIGEPLLELAQLRVVELARRLLAVARDEGHRRAAVEQSDRSLDLPGLCGKLGGERVDDGGHGGFRFSD